ncbi:MAG: hypothetical protein QME90_11735 [Thermodesulfobacteriota bacterium]|nr:hypothetical protein [Thermodesulfobacteriota bacterium]
MKKGTHFLLKMLAFTIIAGMVISVSGKVKAAAYYEHKVISLIVPYGPGGGTDVWARVASINLGRFVPGNPTIVVRNIPGGGSVTGSNMAWSAKPNGLTCLVTGGGVLMNNILRPKGATYRLEKMHPIVSLPTGNVYYVKPGMIKEPKDIMTAKGLVWGHMVVSTGTAGGFVWAIELLGFKLEKLVQGYSGGGESRMAFISGESNFTGGDTAEHFTGWKPFIEKGQAVPVFQQGVMDEGGNVVRESGVPDLPTAPELYEQIYGKKPSGKTWEAYKLFAGTRSFTKTVLLPADTPKEVVEILRKAAEDMAKDPKALNDTAKVAPGASYLTGPKLVGIFPSAVQGSPDLVEFVRKVLGEKYGIVFD